MAQVFVSYKREDISEDFIQHLRKVLEDDGFDVWIDKELLLPGQDWKKEIDNAIKASVALIVIMTPNARQSEYVTYEWAFAVGRGLPVIPIMIKQTDLHPRLNDVQYIDFTNAWADTDSNWNKLLMSLNIEVAKNDEEIVPNAILQAIQDLDSSDEKQRLSALDTLKNSYPHPSAIAGLVKALNHVTTDVRRMAIRYLGHLKVKASAPHIANKLTDSVVKVREEATYVLGRFKDESTIPKLIYGLEDENEYIRRLVLNELLEFKREIIKPYLEELVKNESIDNEVSGRIISTLNRWEDEDRYGYSRRDTEF